MTEQTLFFSKLCVTRDAHCLSLHHPMMTVIWDLAQGGRMVYLEDLRSDVVLIDARAGGAGPDLLVAASATLEEEYHEIRMSATPAEVEIFTSPDGESVRLLFTITGDEVRIERHLAVRMDSPWIEERVFLQNVSDHDLLIDRYPDWEAQGKTAVAGDLYHWGVNPGGVDYLLDGLRIGGDYAGTEYVTPACGYPFFYNRGRFTEMGDTAISMVGGHHGAVLPCIMAYHEEKQCGLLLSCLHDRCLRYVRMYADQAAQTGSITSQVWWARWLAPRERQEVATWHLVPFVGDYGSMLDEYRHWLAREFDIVPPAVEAPHLDELFVGCTHPVVLHGLGHCDKLRPYVDAIREVGCTAYWWGKPWLDAIDVDKRAWMSRCQPQTRDYKYASTTSYGGETAVRALTDYIHEQGMKDIAWVTGYGLTVFDPLYQEHPEMFIRLRRPVKRQPTGDILGHELIPDFESNAGVDDEYIYPPFGGTTIGGDTTNPHWRQFWLHNQAYWAANGVDGIFFDSFNPMPPNYALRPWPGQISLEIVNLQREARRLAQQANPDFFTFTEGGGYLMATVNDFTHTWPGSTAPPLPPFRTQPLTPEEEACFLRDEILSMIPGARSWATVADSDGDATHTCGSAALPRVLFTMFGGRMPILSMFDSGAQPEPITNEPEYWTYFRPRPADDPAPREKAHWERVKAMWQLRMAHPELKSGTLDIDHVTTDNPAVFAFLREKDGHLSLCTINFRPETVTCTLTVDIAALGIAANETLSPRELLTDTILPASTGAEMAEGYTVTIEPRNGVVIKLK